MRRDGESRADALDQYSVASGLVNHRAHVLRSDAKREVGCVRVENVIAPEELCGNGRRERTLSWFLRRCKKHVAVDDLITKFRPGAIEKFPFALPVNPSIV